VAATIVFQSSALLFRNHKNARQMKTMVCEFRRDVTRSNADPDQQNEKPVGPLAHSFR
jgi:hypothetical protein